MPTSTWHPASRWLHWLVALFVAAQAPLGWVGHEMERSPTKIDVMVAHKSLGICILMLVILRILWRWTHPVPGPPEGSRTWEILAARVSHVTLYLLLIALPLSGWYCADTSVAPWKLWWLIPWPAIATPDKELHETAGEVHELLVTLLLIVLVVHVLAALYHHFIRRDGVLLRMLGRRA